MSNLINDLKVKNIMIEAPSVSSTESVAVSEAADEADGVVAVELPVIKSEAKLRDPNPVSQHVSYDTSRGTILSDASQARNVQHTRTKRALSYATELYSENHKPEDGSVLFVRGSAFFNPQTGELEDVVFSSLRGFKTTVSKEEFIQSFEKRLAHQRLKLPNFEGQSDFKEWVEIPFDRMVSVSSVKID